MFNAKFIVVTFLFTAPIILISCGGGDSGIPCFTSSHEEQVGTVSIDSTFRIWLAPNTSTQVFKNSNGASFTMTVDAVYGSTYSTELKTIWATEPCRDDVVLTSKNEQDYISYSSPSLPFSFRVRRSLYLNYDEVIRYQDTVPPKSEYISFYFGNEEFWTYRSDTRNVYLDEYTLLDSSYNQVYVCNNSATKSGLYPIRFILQRGAGLIGFELSNNEVWAAVE